MSNPTKIEWTERTWNPIVGCSLASPGCTNCYAMRMAYRLMRNPLTPQYYDTAKLVNGKPVFTGRVTFAENVLTEPLRRKKPTVYFVNSMGDLFHENTPDEWIDRVFAVMALCPQHTFQVLTKRADRMREYVNQARMDEMNGHAGTMMDCSQMRDHASWPLPNVWLGVSVEDQKRADERVPDLLATPAAIRFISAEPLLGPVDLSDRCNGHYFANWLAGTKWHEGPGLNSLERGGPRIDQVIVGGESGPNARPMHPDWARSLRDQCKAAGTAFFFKQWGEWGNARPKPSGTLGCFAFASFEAHKPFAIQSYPRQFDLLGGSMVLERVGKKAAGRLLDGREWNETPEATA